MMAINGILILDDEEKAVIEADVGPLTSLEVADVVQKLKLVVDQKEREGNLMWANLVRTTLNEVSALSA